MLYKSKLLTLVTMVHSWYVYEYCFMGPSGRFYYGTNLHVCSWVELSVQMRLFPIFGSRVGLPDIHEFSVG